MMESKAKALGHPIHQMLIPFPFGLLATAVIFDVIYLVWGTPTMATVAYWMIIAGIVGGLVAAPFGLIDYLAIPRGTRARSVGLVHGRRGHALHPEHVGARPLFRGLRARGADGLARRRTGRPARRRRRQRGTP
jgi:hypothetical protein